MMAARACSGAAAAIASYLAWLSLTGSRAAGCAPTSGCDELLHSRWGSWLGLPVSVPALLVYATFLGATLRTTSPAGKSLARAWLTVSACSALMIGAAVWFAALQLFVMHKVCPFCMTTHALAAASGLLALAAAPRPSPGIGGPFATAAGLLAVLVTGQLLVQPKTLQVKSVEPQGRIQIGPLATPAARTLPIFSGRFRLIPGEDPVFGSAAAPHLIVSGFDYTCPHCRRLHGLLRELQGKFSNQLAVINLVMPLDAACNPAIRKTTARHLNACELARIGLAVWRANPALAAEYDDWALGLPESATTSEAREVAARLVGETAFRTAMADPWITERLSRNADIYQASTSQDPTGQLPQLIIGASFASGPVGDPRELYKLVMEEFGLKSGE